MTVRGGNVKLRSSVVDAACLISLSNTDAYVQLGEWRTNQFKTVGSDSNAIPFSIQLDECSTHIWQAVSIRFQGIADKHDVQVLAMTSAANTAQGIGLAIFDIHDEIMPINAEPRHVILLNRGVNTLRFFAKYRMTQPLLTPGDASAWAAFTVIYE